MCTSCGTKSSNEWADKPPPQNLGISQQERVRIIITLIRENQNGRSVGIEKVVSEAAKKGIDRECTLDYIQNLKCGGKIYGLKIGEVKCML